MTDQTVRRWGEKGKYPEAYQTRGGGEMSLGQALVEISGCSVEEAYRLAMEKGP